MASNDSYDVIIIGAGISGLVCGCYLAKAGMKVLICEQHDKPGGYFTSFRRNGFLFDAAAHSFGNYREGGHVRKIFTELGVDKLVEIKRFNPSDILITPEFKINFWNDTDELIAELTRIFPHEKTNIINFFRFIASENKIEFTKLRDKTFSWLLRSFFSDEKLISSIAAPVFGSGGLPPSLMQAFIGVKIFSEFILDGGYYPMGGIQKIPDALAYLLKQNNGEIRYKTFVKKILVKNNSAVGIATNANETYNSKFVVSACDMKQTFKTFLGKKIFKPSFWSQFNKMQTSHSFFISYIALKNAFKNLPFEGVNMWYLPTNDIENIYRQIGKCNFTNVIYLFRVSPDKKSILASFVAPFKTKTFWKQNKKSIAANFLNKLEKLIPDLKNHLLYCDSASPSTLYRYTLNYKGAAFGWAKIPSRTLDPIMNKTTPIKNMYLTGHWTGIGFGMPGACYSGSDTGKRIFKKR